MPLALITGAAIRVGRAIALTLAADGYDLIIHANRSLSDAEALRRQVEAMGRTATVEQADLSDLDAVLALADRVSAAPALDLLVHSAAAYAHTDFADITPAALDHMLAVNLRAPFFLTQRLLPALRRSPSASVVAITDMAVRHVYSPTHHFAHYLASKAALDQLVRTLALELGPAVRVNAVAPGPVAMGAETTDAQRIHILERVPLGREGDPTDIATAVAFLARSAYITGTTITVDGGLSIS